MEHDMQKDKSKLN